MSINFHSADNRYSYTSRNANPSWRQFIEEVLEVKGKRIVDIGVGGGIYAKAFVDMGAQHVIGVDSSEEMLNGARENCRENEQISFQLGDALNTGLGDRICDIVLQRALIHHLSETDLSICFAEAQRLLKPGGYLIIQDRTPEDCLLGGNEEHIRGYFFELYPELIYKEVTRRHKSNLVKELMEKVGFQTIKEYNLWEIRQVYPQIESLTKDILGRVGRSILHELTDAELLRLARYIEKKFSGQSFQEIVEKDRWTVWIGENTRNQSLRRHLV